MKRLSIVLTIAGLLLAASPALAMFKLSDTVSANTLTTATLQPPTGLTATGAGADGITVDWTASASSFATGYRIMRSTTSGGPYSEVGTTSSSVTEYDDPVTGGTFYYVVQATMSSWTSVNSPQVNATSTIANTGYLLCSANAAVTFGAGDNNGFQTNPAAGCTNTSTLATDSATGTGTTDTCTGTTKDRHQYYNFGAAIPAGRVIDGIEIRAALRQNNKNGTTRVCAELSWNGGTSWTPPKSVLLTATSETTFTFGADDDLWGRTWALSDATNANFRLRITDSATVTNKTVRLRNLGARFTYH